MLTRERRSLVPSPTLPDFGRIGRKGAPTTGLPGPALLPPISTALSRRAALFGAVTLGVVPAMAPRAAAGVLSSQETLGVVSSNDTLTDADHQLVAMAAELRTVLADTAALVDDDPRDCEDIPGFLALERRRVEISAALFDVSPDSMAGLVAVADIVQQLAEETGGHEYWPGYGHNLACDVLRIIGGRDDA